MPKKNKISEQDFSASVKRVRRKCAGCGEIFDRSIMIKITRDHKSGEIYINPCNNIFGRSAYICYNINCMKHVVRKKRLQKLLRKNIPEEVIQKIESILN